MGSSLAEGARALCAFSGRALAERGAASGSRTPRGRRARAARRSGDSPLRTARLEKRGPTCNLVAPGCFDLVECLRAVDARGVRDTGPPNFMHELGSKPMGNDANRNPRSMAKVQTSLSARRHTIRSAERPRSAPHHRRDSTEVIIAPPSTPSERASDVAHPVREYCNPVAVPPGGLWGCVQALAHA